MHNLRGTTLEHLLHRDLALRGFEFWLLSHWPGTWGKALNFSKTL